MGAMSSMQSGGTSSSPGNSPAPQVPSDYFADRDFAAADMAKAREAMMRDQGASLFSQVFFNVLEYQAYRGRNGYRWDGEARYGGDIERLWLKSEGEGEFGGALDTAEVQALYSRAVGPYFDLQAGLRQDFGRGPGRTYVTAGFEGLAPGFFEVEGAMFLSTTGDILGRFEGYYDQRITQRLILQPRAEVNLSAQDIPRSAIGAGLVDVELGLRLRYEFSRQFAPYVGVSYENKFGETARLSGGPASDFRFTAGVRVWF
jgi:copper resistance protein B